MYIHLGEDELIKIQDVIAILDYQLVEESESNRFFIDHYLKEKKLIDVGQKDPKSIIVTTESIYYSSFSPSTLRKRTEMNWSQLS